MVHSTGGKGTKSKPRGRPFPKGNKRGTNDGVLDATGHSESNGGGAMTPTCEKLNNVDLNTEIARSKIPMESEKQIKPFETLEFKDQDGNSLKIVLSSLPCRRYRMQVFLNDDLEIRPIIYTGTSMAMSFWNLLKGSMKK